MSCEHSEAMYEANEIIRKDVARRLGLMELIAFVCECDESDCYRAVWLTQADYDELRADPTRLLLAPAHEADRLVAVPGESGH